MRFVSLIPLLLIAALPSLQAAEWPAWMGPGSTGLASPDAAPPTTWSETENVTWKTEIPGRAHSSPLIDGDKIWLVTAFETPEEPQRAQERLEANTGGQPLNLAAEINIHALCLDRESGEILHDVKLLRKEEPQWVHKLNTYASSTPVLRDGMLYGHFGSFGTVCMDTTTREVIWTRQDLYVMHENGPGSSPVLWEDLMIFHMDGSDQQFIIALDVETSETVWQTPRSGELNENPQMQKSYATPAIGTWNGKAQVVSPSADWLYFYDAATGKELHQLSYGQLGFSNVARPVVAGNRIYMPTSFMKSMMLGIEYDGQSAPEILWSYTRAMPRVTSPILVEDTLYALDEKGIISSLDAESGESHWQERLAGNYSASPVYAAGNLYLCSQEGLCVVVRADKEFQVLSENEMETGIMATPAFVDDQIYIRTEQALYRIEED